MWIGAQPFVRAGNSHEAKRIARQRAGIVARDILMCQDSLDHLRINPQDGIERHHRVLKDHGDAPTA